MIWSRTEEQIEPGRYAAVDIGTNSVLLLVADIAPDGALRPVAEGAALTRLGEGLGNGARLHPAAMLRTRAAVCEFVDRCREHRVDALLLVGTAVLREAENAAEFTRLIEDATGLPVETLSGEQEAELAFAGNRGDARLPNAGGERVIVDIGGGSTEIVRGNVEGVYHRESYRVGAVCLTERYLREDPPSPPEFDAAQQAIEAALGVPELLPPRAALLGTGGTVLNLAAIARAGGIVSEDELHGCTLTHAAVADLLDLFRYLPLEFRRRCPGLEPERADIILAGALILHQVMGLLSAPRLVVSASGLRQGCVHALARRHVLLR